MKKKYTLDFWSSSVNPPLLPLDVGKMFLTWNWTRMWRFIHVQVPADLELTLPSSAWVLLLALAIPAAALPSAGPCFELGWVSPEQQLSHCSASSFSLQTVPETLLLSKSKDWCHPKSLRARELSKGLECLYLNPTVVVPAFKPLLPA